MKVLLDEDLPHKLRLYLTDCEVFTATYAGLSGLKNGKLLDTAEASGFEVLVTADQTMPYEQNMAGRKIAVVVLSVANLPLLEPHAGRISQAIAKAAPATVTRVECGAFSRRRN